MSQLYKALVEVTFGILCAVLVYMKDVIKLERVSRIRTRVLLDRDRLSYSVGLDRLGLYSLEGRSLKDDLNQGL